MKNTCVFVILFISGCVSAKNEIFDQLGSCGFGVADLDQINICLTKAVGLIHNQIFTEGGVPGLNLTDPMYVKPFQFIQKHGAVNIIANFSNIVATEHRSGNLTNISASRTPPSLNVGLFVPYMVITGAYVAGGNVLYLEIEGDGNFLIKLNNTKFEVTSFPVVETDANGKKILKPTGSQLELEIGNIDVTLDGLFDNDPILSESINHFLNENSQFILEEIKPRLSEIIAGIVEELMEGFLGRLSISTIFPDLSILNG